MVQSRIDTTLLEEKIGYQFINRDLIERALIHSSYSNETGVRNHHLLCNERLEFLGDSVLSIITSNYLYKSFTDCPEGELTRMRAEVVCEKALSGYATEIGLGDYLLLGVGEEKNNGRQRKSILADAFEALLAAIYLDAGERGLDEIRRFLLPMIKDAVEKNNDALLHADAKTELQQLTQVSDGATPTYCITGESGPDHAKIFEVEVKLNSNVIGHGKGRSKREAEQNAAREALKLFGV